jgi:hypothetical protein
MAKLAYGSLGASRDAHFRVGSYSSCTDFMNLKKNESCVWNKSTCYKLFVQKGREYAF